MNALIRWDPFKEMEELQSQFTKLFGLTPARSENGGKELMTITEWAPSVDIIEDEKEWLVKADLPEVKKDDVFCSNCGASLTAPILAVAASAAPTVLNGQAGEDQRPVNGSALTTTIPPGQVVAAATTSTPVSVGS